MAPDVLLGFTTRLTYTNKVFSYIYNTFETKINGRLGNRCLFIFCSQQSLSTTVLVTGRRAVEEHRSAGRVSTSSRRPGRMAHQYAQALVRHGRRQRR